MPHQPASSPYKASGPIYVRTTALQATLTPGTIQDYVHRRLMSVRAYDDRDWMRDATVDAGADSATVIDRMFDDSSVAYIHLHNANRGCFSCRAQRL